MPRAQYLCHLHAHEAATFDDGPIEMECYEFSYALIFPPPRKMSKSRLRRYLSLSDRDWRDQKESWGQITTNFRTKFPNLSYLAYLLPILVCQQVWREYADENENEIP